VSVEAKPIVSCEWLSRNLGDESLRILDASWYLPEYRRDPKREYLEGHIPGAVFFDIEDVADQQTTLEHMLPPAAEFAEKVERLGVSNSHHVVVYDTRGIYSAARAWWMFRVFGHEKVSVLDGGYVRWRLDGRPAEPGRREPASARFVPAFRPELLRSAEDVLRIVSDGGAQLVDARKPGRFLATEANPYPGVRDGHIPTSVNLFWGDLLNDADGTLVGADEIRKFAARANVDPARDIVASCGSGVTACIVALSMHVLGNRNCAVYDGSWAEWGRRQDLPIET
jgi:thiosulfate/3-mercaptopyruvate sulfurtransferase